MTIIKLIITSLLVLSSFEQTFAFHPMTNKAQKNFSADYNRGAYKKSLKQFNSIFSKKYITSTDGAALQSLLMFKSGAELSGLKTLLNIKNPQSISDKLKLEWRKHLKVSNDIWKIINTKISKKWNVVFPYIGNYSGYLFPHYSPKNLKQLNKLEKQNIKSVIMLDWHNYQLGIWNGILDRAQRGLKYLNKIPSNSKTVDFNQIFLAKARINYQVKNFSEAIRQYQKISKSSDYWTTSIEEQAYTYTVMGKPGMGLAKLKSLFTSVLIPFAGAEPYMLTAFNQEQNCDYISSFKTVTNYKKTFIPRARALKKISKGQLTPEVSHLLTTHRDKKLAWSNVSQHITLLPSLLYNDKFLIKYFNGKSALLTEPALLRKLSVSQNIINKIDRYAKARIPYLDKKIKNRLSFLAKKDLKVISNITKKMHLIEAEAIQQLHIKKDIKQASQFNASKSREVMVFPDDGEVWLDEIDKYNASIGFCKKKKGKQL